MKRSNECDMVHKIAGACATQSPALALGFDVSVEFEHEPAGPGEN
jgi:hypothetical protein